MACKNCIFTTKPTKKQKTSPTAISPRRQLKSLLFKRQETVFVAVFQHLVDKRSSVFDFDVDDLTFFFERH